MIATLRLADRVIYSRQTSGGQSNYRSRSRVDHDRRPVDLLRAMWTSSLRNVTSSSRRRRLSPACNVYRFISRRRMQRPASPHLYARVLGGKALR